LIGNRALLAVGNQGGLIEYQKIGYLMSHLPSSKLETDFAAHYVAECKKRGEAASWEPMYKLLDDCWAWTRGWTEEQKKKLALALDNSRIAVLLPAKLVTCDRLSHSLHSTENKASLELACQYYDMLDSETKEPLYASTPGTDIYRISLIHYLADAVLTKKIKHAWRNNIEFLCWAIRRLEKFSTHGSWAEYVKHYK
jgi:hypothetical protein